MLTGTFACWLWTVRPKPGTLRQDAIAGVPGAIGSVLGESSDRAYHEAERSLAADRETEEVGGR